MSEYEKMDTNIDRNDYPDPYHEKTCPAVGYQKVSVAVPVTIIPFAHAGKARITCCGHPTVISGERPCSGKKDDICTFTISQTICVEVPVSFGAKTKVGETYVDCLKASAYDLCDKCDCGHKPVMGMEDDTTEE